MDSEARFVMLCEAEDGSLEVEPTVILKLGKGVVLSTWMILLLLVTFSILILKAEPPSVMGLWMVKFTTSEELEQAK